MKRPKLKKASKRISCSKRYKILKKVRDHTRKLRKEAKKKGVTKRVKKDCGVPSSAPFKEEVLREAEQRRLQIEEEKEKKKQAVKEERAKKRKQDKETGSKGKEPKAKKARQDENGKPSKKQSNPEKNSKLFLCGEINKVIDASDVVIEVLDARDPLGCRCPQLEEAVLQRGGNKKLLFVLNKIDLVPKENVEKWIQSLQKVFPVVAFKASTQIKDRAMEPTKTRIVASNEALDTSRGAVCLGKDCLTDLLTSYAATIKKDVLRVGIVGFPNVGKSSLLNSLKEIRACNTGINRGTTKFMQEVLVSNTLRLIDGPGIVASPSNPPASMALRSLQVEEGQETVLEAVRNLLKQCDHTQVMLRYSVPNFRNSLEFLTMFAKKRGYLQKGAVANVEQAATVFLADWTGPKLIYHSKPSEDSLPAYLSDTVISDMQNGWDLSKLKTGNAETLKGVKSPYSSSSISFISKGPTAGLLNVSEIVEEKPAAPVAQKMEVETDEPEQIPEEPNVMEETAEPEKPEQMEQTEVTEQTEATSLIKKPTKVHFPVDVNLSAPTASADDAYDFNTDFK